MVLLEGMGLHGGRPARLTLDAALGPVTLRVGGTRVPISALEVTRTERATTVKAPGGAFTVSTVEHVFSALAGSSISEGVSLELVGDEMPMLDGAAAEFFDALATLQVRPSVPHLRVARTATVEVGASRFEFAPSDHPRVQVVLDWGDDDRLERDATWNGDSADFRERIAIARTFAFERDLLALADARLARHVDPKSVVVIAKEIHSAGRPFSADEPARHKLLDLVGDTYVHGGPPIGTLVAHRPGHSVNHIAMSRALALGVLVHVT